MLIELQCDSSDAADKLCKVLKKTTSYYYIIVCHYSAENCTVKIETEPMGHGREEALRIKKGD